MTDLGELLNTIERPTTPCPGCKKTEPMWVFVNAARWRCGYTRPLPPIAPTGRQSVREAKRREVRS